jgi:hypothetical protein
MQARFDDPSLVSCAGVVPVLRLAQDAGLYELVEEWVGVPGHVGSNPAGKVASIVAGMIAGADSIDDLNIVRHGGMKQLFAGVYAPSTLGSFLRGFTFGHVRQVQAVATRMLVNLVRLAPGVLPADKVVFVDVDSVLRRVYGKAKQGVAFGHAKVGGYSVLLRGLNPLIATISTRGTPPVVAATRIRAGNAASGRGAANLVADAVRTAFDCTAHCAAHCAVDAHQATVILRGDSAFYSAAVIGAAKRNGACFSVTAKQDAKVKAAIASIGESVWTPIRYPKAVWDDDEQRWISDAEIAEVPYTAFAHTRHAVTARLIVRRVHRIDHHLAAGQEELFASWRYHAVLTDNPHPLVQAEAEHRGHAVIELTLADLISGPLAHLPSGRIGANGAWLALAGITHNLTRAAACLAGHGLDNARGHTIRTRLINVAARIVRHARTITLRLPQHWPWQAAWHSMHTHTIFTPG